MIFEFLEVFGSFGGKTEKKKNLLGVLESAFASWVEKSDQMSAAHIANFIDSIVSKQIQQILYC